MRRTTLNFHQLCAPLLAIAIAASAAGPAAAREGAIDLAELPAGAAAMRAALACAPDAQRLCPDTPRGGGRVIACLSGQRDRLSAPCAEEFARGAQLADAITVCAPDISTYCDTVIPGGGRVLSCLVGNQDRISPACYDGLAASFESYGGSVD